MSHHLALYTFAIFEKPAEDPANDSFYTLNDRIIELVDQAPGLIGRSGYDDEPGPESWGTYVLPEFYKEQGDGWSPSTLSLWSNIESARQFAYEGLHALALARRRRWFREPEWPSHALWWVPTGTRPTWTEAVERHARLHREGPSPDVITFQSLPVAERYDRRRRNSSGTPAATVPSSV